mgnify:CR=1 FL=1
MKIKISIIIPTLNSSKTLKRCIDSVFNQTFKKWEIIIIDGGSKDNTIDIVKNYNSKKIKILREKSKKSISAARYRGIVSSKGKYIAFLDSDDKWAKEKLCLQIDKIDKNIDFVCTNFKLRNQNRSFNVKSSKDYLTTMDIIYNRPIALSSVLIKKKIIIKTIKKDLSLNFAEDFYWWTNILQTGKKCLIIKKYLTFIYLHKNNRSTNYISNYYSLIKIYRNSYSFSYLKILFIFILLSINTFKKNVFKYKAF